MDKHLVLGDQPLTIEDVINVAENAYTVSLSKEKSFVDKINASNNYLKNLIDNDVNIYGVTTGFGDSCETLVEKGQLTDLPLYLSRYHQCGLGDFFTPKQARAVQITRLSSLIQGKSGVSFGLLNLMVEQLNHNISPKIPQEGSVGASGDLTPLAYLASTLVGESELYFEGKYQPTMDVYNKLNLKPIKLQPKEGLALMNGTAVMTALACSAFEKASYLCKILSRVTAMSCLAIKGNKQHFAEGLFVAKPFPGQALIAKQIRSDLDLQKKSPNAGRIQDRYSIRCAPHVIGVLQDALPFFKKLIETELNSANDNPLIDAENEEILHGGNFYGGHISFVMDSMKNLVANLSDLVDRQMALVVDSKFNNGLPANLSGASKDSKNVCHGFKAVQIGVSAWTAEALKNTMPASVFSRSTECHNQDKVSMGTISARDCLRVIQLTQQVAAASVLITSQALQLRLNSGEFKEEHLSEDVKSFKEDVLSQFKLVEKDRPLDLDLRRFVNFIDQRRWKLYQ